MKPPIITLTTDFGTSDHYVAAMKGVILGICPTATLVDISHSVAPYSVLDGAYLIGQASNAFPPGTVHLVVVDPGVGSQRRAILAEADGQSFVAPDNGVLSLVLEGAKSIVVREITASQYFRQPVSQTFHGRDVFAPVAAAIANGIPPAEVGSLIGDYRLCSFAKPVPRGPGQWEGTILRADRFGNLITNFEAGAWRLARQPFAMRVGECVIGQMASSYAAMNPGELYVIEGSAGFLEISLNQKSAAAATGVGAGGAIHLHYR